MKYVQILDSVICINWIAKVTILYHNGKIYDKYFHVCNIEYKNGKTEQFETTDLDKARRDFEALKNELLSLNRNKE